MEKTKKIELIIRCRSLVMSLYTHTLTHTDTIVCVAERDLLTLCLHTDHSAIQRRQNARATGLTSGGAGGTAATGGGKAMGLNDVGLGWLSSKVPKVPRSCSGGSSESGRAQASARGRDRRGGVSEPPRVKSSREGGVASTGERSMGGRGGGV